MSIKTCVDIFRSFICNSEKLETIQMSIHRWIKKQIGAYQCNRVLSSNENDKLLMQIAVLIKLRIMMQNEISQIGKKKKKNLHIAWFHFYKVLEKNKWINSDRNQISGWLQIEEEGGLDYRRHKKTFGVMAMFDILIVVVALWVCTCVKIHYCMTIIFKDFFNSKKQNQSQKIKLGEDKVWNYLVLPNYPSSES